MNLFTRLLVTMRLPTMLLAATAVLTACHAHPVSQEKANMVNLSPSLQPLFEKTKTVCFGRFMIDLPEQTRVVWGDVAVPLSVWVEKGQADEISNRVAEVEAHLKSEIRFPRTENLTLYFETISGAVPGMRHIISQRDAGSDGLLRINSFFAMSNNLVGMQALPLANDKDGTIDEINDMARRLRPRHETEVPTEPGTCIENAFLAEAPGTKPEDVNEHIRVGFRLKEFPDVHLSIYIGPANEMRWSLEQQLDISVERARKAGRPEPFRMLTVFRRAKREINEWKTGFEYLTRTPNEDKSYAHHDFWMKFTGTPGNPLQPYADIDFKTGVGENSAGAVKPSLSDEEAIALWDKLTGSIRIRPTGNAKTSQTAPVKAPLGERHVTGHRCPQAGWWECDDELNLAQPKGLWLNEGDLVPMALVWAQPTLWQQFRGERPRGKVPAVWRLAAYEAPPDTAPAKPAQAGEDA
ncbi:T6SS immunity protein Tli4 family protein [Azohydromonas caseinilytica]|uniref:Tle cognate immunity protein 4 C-terminal domain-containing protein n=1 Tax=Azohydromonas caseinilytica TaxID=2728836 RepID=A0A848F6A7_9BURK|nr:T6SS immunity protein Tli4 family protein [Azohydromonas caseinilytica]NML14922.1 hypothetical protein [Azohydromonas caseinilytica]